MIRLCPTNQLVQHRCRGAKVRYELSNSHSKLLGANDMMGTSPNNNLMDAIGGMNFQKLSKLEKEDLTVLLDVLDLRIIWILLNPRVDPGPFQVLSFLLSIDHSLLKYLVQNAS